jgi:ergothioneine biosynthesis protein EgtB
MTPVTQAPAPADLARQFCKVRQQTIDLCAPLSPEDMMVQSCPEASPVKWHLAHTTWFFETFLLREHLRGYQPFHPDFIWLFNSYYNAVSDQPAKMLRASFSRPGLDQILDYRRHVDAAMQRLLEEDLPDDLQRRVVLGLNHEQQHQELIATDIKHALYTNPLRPAYLADPLAVALREAYPAQWIEQPAGLYDVGFAGEGFAFDNETPRHPEYLRSYSLASRAVTCAEYLEFIEDRGYQRPELWLSEGWETGRAQRWQAPLYWHRSNDGAPWSVFTMRGDIPLEVLASTPVCHVSYFEADAFARWSGMLLPTESEWEVMAAGASIEGNLLDSGNLHPLPAPAPTAAAQLYGDVWEWTASAYLGYPGFRPLPGALGEYNGKFMCNQMVLRGGSVATPASHIRASYRNFFSPATRWQFSGVRLANR